jgi:hypothetical protein
MLLMALKIADVDEQQAQLPSGFARLDGCHDLVEAAAVAQSGERIAQQFGLGTHALGFLCSR